MNIVTISSKNQITLPIELLISLGITPREKLLVDTKDNLLVLKPLKTSVTDEVAGSLTKHISSGKLGTPLSIVFNKTKKITAKKLSAK